MYFLISALIGAFVAWFCIRNIYTNQSNFSNHREYAIDWKCHFIGLHLGFKKDTEKKEAVIEGIQTGEIGVI